MASSTSIRHSRSKPDDWVREYKQRLQAENRLELDKQLRTESIRRALKQQVLRRPLIERIREGSL